MPNPCDLAEDDGVLDDSYQSNILDAGSADAATLDDTHAHVIVADTVETGVLNDEVVERATLEVNEAAVLNDAVVITGTFSDNAVERALISDDSASVLTDNAAEAAVLNDAVAQSLVAAPTVETAVLNDAVTTGGTFTNSAVEAAVLDDAVRVQVRSLVADDGVLNDAVTETARLADSVAEAAVLNDAVSIGATVSTEYADAAVLDDAYQDHLTGSNSVVEVGYLDDAVVGGGNAAWRSHVEPWAMSRYDNMPWNSMATIGGALFAAGPEGIYQLVGATDAGTNISAELVHDWLNWSPGRDGQPVADNHLKRPRYLYLEEVKVDGQLALSLGYVTIDGAKSESEYPLPDTTATGFVNIRVPLGRGIRSQHLRPTIYNVDGADFEFGGGRLAVDSLARNL